jgi:hypothetical protein
MKLDKTPIPKWFRKNDDTKIGKSAKEMNAENWDKAMNGSLTDEDLQRPIKKQWEKK